MRAWLWILFPALLAAEAVRPAGYELDLRIVPKLATFEGTVRIDLIFAQRTDSLRLNARDLSVRAAFLRTGETRVPLSFSPAGEETIGAALPSAFGPGTTRLEIEYSGRLNEKDNVGAFRRQLNGEWYVFTTFTAIDARRVFPCFDDPAYKTPWKLTLHVERSQMAAANTPTVAETGEAGGMKQVTFAPSKPLPSELVAFAVGPFDAVDAGVAGRRHVPVRILVPRGRSNDAAAARDATAAILARLEEYTGIPYPWEKLDHLALVEGAFGATENPGLISYQEQILLAHPDRDTSERRRNMRQIMTHELAHQWFGNLVTQASWTDVWLSEGLATWMEAKLSDREMAAAERRSHIMGLDASNESRPVRRAMHSRAGMADVYSPFVYSKGASILAMMEDWLGAEPFARGLRRYLREHAYANASTDDLAQALRAETGQDVAPVLHGLLDRAGVPMVSARAECRSVKFEPRDSPLPVCLHWDGGRKCVVAGPGRSEVRLEGEGCPAWISLNASGMGYYRASVTPEGVEAVLNTGGRQITPAERLALAEDMGAMVASGRIAAAAAMPALTILARDREPNVVLAALRIATAIVLAAPPGERHKYEEWLRTLWGRL
jgi:alanyl aminopeptidase